MIIRFPTGLYSTALPQGTNAGNITYIISSSDPPKTEVRSIQLPVFEKIRSLPSIVFNKDDRRNNYGELVYTISKPSVASGSNSKQFEVGEILEFDDDVDDVDTVFVKAPDNIEIQHNTNVLNLEDIGLTDDDINILIYESVTKKRQLEEEFVKSKSDLNNIRNNIRENQKAINEVKKTIKAVRSIYNIADNDLTYDNDIYQKLLTTESNLENTRDQLILNQSSKASEVEQIYKNLLRVSQLVR